MRHSTPGDLTHKLHIKEKIIYKVLIASIILGSILIFWGFCAVNRFYEVWAQRKKGEAELAKAEANRRIKILEAAVSQELALHLAQAEITRARGVAESNKIIGDSLKENEGYLRYLWIVGLENKNKEIIYIPTEANLPILEAGKTNTHN